jgi:hypothetical protein
VIDQDPIRTDRRRRRRQERFGSSNPICVLCGWPHIETLTPVTIGWLYAHGIELHHAWLKAHDPDFVMPLCLNCHRQVTEGIACAGVNEKPEPDPVKRAVHMLNAMAVFDEARAASSRRLAADLLKSRENSK